MREMTVYYRRFMYLRTLLLLLLPFNSWIAVNSLSAQDNDRQLRYDAFFLEAMMQREQSANDAAFDLLRHCVEIDSTRAEAYYFLGQYYDSMRKKEEALHCYSKAAQLSPTDITILEGLSEAYRLNGRQEEAIATLEKIMTLDHEREDVLTMLVQLNHHQGKYAEAINCIERIEELEGKSAHLSSIKGELYTLLGNKEAAIAEMKALADHYPNDISYRGMYGEMLLNNGEQDAAYQVFLSICQDEPDNLSAQFFLQNYYQETGQQDKADSLTMHILLNKEATIEQQKALIWKLISNNEQQGGDSTVILNLFDRLLQEPQKDAKMAILCTSYMSVKRMPEDTIAGMLKRILSIEPDEAVSRLKLVGYAWQQDSMPMVVDLCKMGRQYNPDQLAFYYYQSLAHYRMKQNDEALAALKAGVKINNEDTDPDLLSDCYELMGDMLYRKGREKEAFAAYDSCLQWKPNNIGCLNNYAYYLSELNTELERAEKMSKQTIEAEPKNATYLDTYAWILFLQGRKAEAKIYIDEATQLIQDSIENAVIIEHAADIYAENGMIDKAVELWEKVKEVAEGEQRKLITRKINKRKYIAPKLKKKKK